jgi:hypothetical protein
MTKQFETKYIEFYCQARKDGYELDIAKIKGYQDFQCYVIDLLLSKPALISIIGTAYENVTTDKWLDQRALITYDLSQCDDDVKNKYLPLLV